MEINTGELPDVQVMQQSEIRMLSLYHSETTGLSPALHERLFDLVTLVKAGNRVMREYTVSSLVSLNSEPAPEEEELLRLRQQVETEMQGIVSAIEAVSSYRSPNYTDLRQDQDAAVAGHQLSVTKLQATLEQQHARLDEVDQVLATLQHPSVQKALRSMIPEEKDIDSVFAAIKDPTVSPELVKAAVAKLNQHLDLFEEGRKFADVVRARRRLANALAEQKRTLAQLQRQLEEAQQSSSRFARVDELLAQRTPWVEQASKFVSAWQVHAQAISAATQMDALLSAMQGARDYLLGLRRRFEAV